MKIDVYCGANQSYIYMAPSLKPSSVKMIHLSCNTTICTSYIPLDNYSTHTHRMLYNTECRPEAQGP